MKLAHRLFLFLVPVVIFSGLLMVFLSWRAFEREIGKIADEARRLDGEELLALSRDPLFRYYFEDAEAQYAEAARRDLEDIRLLFRDRLEWAQKTGRDHLQFVFFGSQWEVLVGQATTSQEDIADKGQWAEYFSQPANRRGLLSNLEGDHHRAVVAILPPGGQGDALGYLHVDHTLPTQRFRERAWGVIGGQVWINVLQWTFLLLFLYWVGRKVPKPLERFTGQVKQLARSDFNAPFVVTTDIQELRVLGEALESMRQEMALRQTELIAARDRIERSERMLRTVLDTIPVRVYWKDREGRYLGCNALFAQDAGEESPLALVGRIDHDLPWHHQSDRFAREERRVVEGGRTLANVEELRIHAGGHPFWVESAKVPLRGRGDSILGVLGVYHDVTSRRRAEEERDRFFQISRDMMAIVDQEGNFERVNLALLETSGFQPEELIGKSFLEIIHPDDREQAWNGFRHILSGRSLPIISMRLFNRDAESRIAEWSAIGWEGKVFAVGRDVTEHKRIEEQLRITQFSVDHASDGLFGITPEGRFFLVNEAACSSLGYSREELLQMTVSDVRPDFDDRTWLAHWQKLKEVKKLLFEAVHVHRQGHRFPVEVSANYMAFGGREFNFAFVRNITSRKQAEEQLRQYAEDLERMVKERTRQLIHAERLASLGTFSAGIAHEINNPNAFISANVELLQLFVTLARPILEAHVAEDESLRLPRFLSRIDGMLADLMEGSRRITRIVESLKTYSKGGEGSDKAPCRLADPVGDAATLLSFRLKKGVELEIDVPGEHVLHCDRQQISQVLVNLLQNALDAMENQEPAHARRITVSTRWQGEGVRRALILSVTDNGPGIPESVVNRIFDPFFTTKGKTKGTGLGLSIVHGIVRDHGGRIEVISPLPGEERGCRFEIVFPQPMN